MAQIQTLQPAVITIKGKAAKRDKVHFKTMHGKTFMVRVDNPYDGPASEAQKTNRTKFTTVWQSVRNLPVEDPNKYQEMKRLFAAQRKYVTLNGYIFHKLWDEEQNGD